MRSSLRRPGLTRAVAIAAGLLAGFALVELGAAALYAIERGGLIWVRGAPAHPKHDLRAQGDKRLRLHPYYGYAGRPGMRIADVTDYNDMLRQFGERFVAEDYPTIAFNSHGFLSHVEYPYQKRDDEFVVGVFGGSVALQFSLVAQHAMADVLERTGVLRGRRLVLLDFANGGAKQPQQAAALAYFLALGQRFDYIVNLDGFNEAFIGWYNFVRHRAAPEMPFARFIFGIQNVDLAEVGVPVGEAEHRRAALAVRRWSEREASTRSAAVWFVSGILSKVWKGRLVKLEQAAAGKLETFDYSMPLPSAPPGSFETIGASRIVDSWRDASIAMKGMSDRFGISYLHVLQPNQYVTDIDFGGSADERKRVLGLEEPPVAELIPLVYAGYRQQADRLRAAGVDFFDASRFFDGRPSSLFFDNCCHFNYDANAQLAAAIAKRMAVP
jgi:hypothetical protein